MAEWIAPAVSQDRQPRSLDEGKGRRCQAGQNFNEQARRGVGHARRTQSDWTMYIQLGIQGAFLPTYQP